jgi:phosphatidylserine/phosphatidylglycerophosphate/cardiolipin synthase-like enzyme
VRVDRRRGGTILTWLTLLAVSGCASAAPALSPSPRSTAAPAASSPTPAGGPASVTAVPSTATAAATAAATATAAGGSDDSLVVEPEQGMGTVYQAITGARHSLDLVIYELEDTIAVNDLIQAKDRGVSVRVILDQAYAKSQNESAYATLAAHGVDVHWSSTQVDITHQKTLIVDSDEALVMTGNMTSQYYASTRDFILADSDARDVAAIEAVFDADFSNTAVQPSPGDDLVWSPGSAAALVGLIQGAKKELLVENEEMSDQEIVVALEAAAQRGVDVQVCMTDSSSWSSEFSDLTHDGVRVYTYSPDAALYIHAKAIVADPRTDSIRWFLGSENFSSTSLDLNRELGVELNDASMGNRLASVIDGDIAGASPWSAS